MKCYSLDSRVGMRKGCTNNLQRSAVRKTTFVDDTAGRCVDNTDPAIGDWNREDETQGRTIESKEETVDVRGNVCFDKKHTSMNSSAQGEHGAFEAVTPHVLGLNSAVWIGPLVEGTWKFYIDSPSRIFDGEE